MKPILVLLALSLMMGMCDRISNKPQNPILGRYEFVAHDNSGRLVFTGTISFILLEQNYLNGQCTVIREKDAPEGLFDQQGDCAATIDGKKLDLDFAPLLDDAGLLFEGEFDAARISGIWRLDGFFTSEPLGKFEAVKKE